jgi:RND family efflux transporter MFP subunit
MTIVRARIRRLLPASVVCLATAAVACGSADEPVRAERDTAAASTPEGIPRAPVTLDTRRRQLVGVRTAPVERAPVAATARAPGTVALAETGVAEISAKVDGWVKGLRANATGMTLERNEPLFVLYSPTLLALENEFVAALHGRQQATRSAVPEAREHADQMVDIVRGRLLALDVDVAEVRELERRGRALGEMTFRSPASGVIVDKDVVEGMFVSAGQRLFRVADLSTVWVEARVHERDLGLVATGQTVAVEFDAFPGAPRQARVLALGSAVSQETRTLPVRLAVSNPGGRLKPGMYASVTFTAPSQPVLSVPRDAIVDSGVEQVVFLAEGDGYFEPRTVRTGRRLGDRVEILEGLTEGQSVASSATFFIDSESQLRGALQSYTRSPEQGATGSASRDADVAIDVQFEPDPPRAGVVTLTATVTRAGRGVDDGRVEVVLSMPPMPSMGMGAMQARASLTPSGGGRYTGQATLPHAGRWDVEVTVTENGRTVGRLQTSILAS